MPVPPVLYTTKQNFSHVTIQESVLKKIRLTSMVWFNCFILSHYSIIGTELPDRESTLSPLLTCF